MLSEPVDSPFTSGEFGNDTGLDIAALVGTPTDKAGAPVHTLSKAVPAPIGFAAYIADLGSCYFYNQGGSIRIIEDLSQGVVTQHMRNIVHITITVPAVCFGGFHGKLNGIGFGIFAVFVHGPCDVALSIVIALQCQLDRIHVHRAFALGNLQTVRQILNAHVDGILWISDATGDTRIKGVEITLGALHGIIATTTGFLHHYCLDQQHIISNAMFSGILLNDRFVSKHFCTDR